MSRHLLKEFIRALISEAAMPVAAAQQQGLALLVTNSGRSTSFVLYDPKYYRDFIVTQENSPNEIGNAPDGIYAFFSAFPGPSDSCSGAYEIGVSSAKKGFGPMMYDIVMSQCSPAPIMADRSTSSAAAANIWRFYGNRSDVEKIPLDSNDCKTYEDRPELNYAFKAKQPVNFSGLVAAHQKFIQELSPENQTAFEKAVPYAGAKFFDLSLENYK